MNPCLHIFIVAFIILSGCTYLPQSVVSPYRGDDTPAGQCADFFAALDQAVKQAGIRDPGEFRLKNYPYLRADRFLASYSAEIADGAAFDDWVKRLQLLDQKARFFEIANLPPKSVTNFYSETGATAIWEKVVQCGDILKTIDFRDTDQRQKLRANVRAFDDYILSRRILGLYPITSMFVASGIYRYQSEVRKSFSNQPPPDWQKIRYVPAVSNHLQPYPSDILQTAGRDAIGLPEYSSNDQRVLFDYFAPFWEVQTEGDFDRIGAPFWTADKNPGIDTNRTICFRRFSFTRFRGEVLTQLNYVIWFPARPKEHALDILGGFIDGLIYRVTLDRDGQPLLYETVHNCGCYHKFYPTDRLQVLKNIDYAERPLVLKAPSADPDAVRMVIALKTRTHYVKSLYPVPREMQIAGVSYAFADYDQLRSLKYSEHAHRSFFGEGSIVAGTERLERYLLWPTGVLSPGAMRQWGRHAVAFMGKRHFDDPNLMAKIFQRVDSP
ncbi:MAG: hypothetical protein JSW39_26355 [Desulfobacterales bacterium]|nr:MAG: hypothetical protein JSW39_26355 [Desulfobacterales bacterium]